MKVKLATNLVSIPSKSQSRHFFLLFYPGPGPGQKTIPVDPCKPPRPQPIALVPSHPVPAFFTPSTPYITSKIAHVQQYSSMLPGLWTFVLLSINLVLNNPHFQVTVSPSVHCDCLNFRSYPELPCKHLLAVIRETNVEWADLPLSFR